ncbi:MAG: two-component regulator propeller domain-containing protein [Saprospiraceae bacterium]
MRKHILVIFLISLVDLSQAQDRIGGFMAYGYHDGLPPSLYYGVCQSSDGYLWIGSSSGLVRFDGKRYQTFFSDYKNENSLSDNVIVDLIEDNEQNLWLAGLYQGLSKYNLRSGHIRRYSRLSSDNTPGYGINTLFLDEAGELWIGTAGRGLAHYLSRQDTFEFFIPDPQKPFDGSNRDVNNIFGIAVHPSTPHIFWLSCFDGLYSFDRSTKKFTSYPCCLPNDHSSHQAFICIEMDQGEKIWLGTWIDGLFSYDMVTGVFETHPYENAEVPNSIKYQVLDIENIDDTTLYLASRNLGLLGFNKKNSMVYPLLTNDQLPDGSSSIDIQEISKTPDAGIFVGGNYYIYQQHKAFNRFSNALYSDDSSWIGMQHIVYDSTRSGYWMSASLNQMVFITKDMKHQESYQTTHEPDIYFNDVAIDRKNRVWVSSIHYGLRQVNIEKHLITKPPNEIPGMDTLARQIVAIKSDASGNLWLLSVRALYYLDVLTNKIDQIVLPEASEISSRSLAIRVGNKDDIWISSNNGLYHYRIASNSFYHIMPDDQNKNGIANPLIKSMTIDRNGNAWIGFESDGVQIVSVDDHHIIASYNLNHGLPGMQINQLTTDTSGRIWAGTSAGLALFDPEAEVQLWQLFNRQDGIRRDYIDRAIMATKDGKLFFNIEKGISWIDFEKEGFLQENPPILHLTSLTTDGVSYRNDLLPNYIHQIELSYGTKEIRIEYAAMDWLHPTRTKYFYRIEGINEADEWIENNQAVITLTGLKPGQYLLRLYALNGDGKKSRELNLPILLHPPFWQRWWFIVLCALGIMGIGYAIYHNRIGQLKKIQAMRKSISTNLHDDIGASLSNIHILTVLTGKNIRNEAEATSYITKAGDEIQRISEALSDIVWNISPRYDDLDKLFVRMKRYAADMLEGKNIMAHLEFPDMTGGHVMKMDQRRDFYLIFKESVNNLVKYSDATEASIRVEMDHQVVRMLIHDNGKGYDKMSTPDGNGIINMKQRAEKWKSKLDINSTPEKGTRIHLEMKIE